MLEYNEFNLYLIRHGQSAVNVIPDNIGQAPDTPLTEYGKQQAALLGDRLAKEVGQFLYTYSSNYTRALDTAKIATQPFNNNIQICPALREYSAGDWAGSKRSQTISPQIALRMGHMNSDFIPPNGESMNQVQRRVSQWLEETILYNSDIQQIALSLRQSNKPKMNLGVFSHGMTIRCLLAHLIGIDKSFIWKIEISNTSITKLSFGEDGWRLLCVNDCAHLLHGVRGS